MIISSWSFGQHHAFLDAGKTDFASGEILKLDGEWEFYWNKLYSPADFRDSVSAAPDLLTKPSSWNDLVVNGQKCGSYGFATYRLTLQNLPAIALMVNAYSMQTSCLIFINGQEVAHVGKVGTTKESTSPMTRDMQILIPAENGTAEIIVQVANFHHRKGGFVHPFEIGKPDVIVKNQNFFYILDSVESAALAIIGFFLLALYIFRRKDLSVLYFALFSITLSLRPVISVNYLVADLWPDINWSLMLKLEYLGVMFPCLFMVLFIRQLFPKQLSLTLVRIFIVIFSLKILITLLFPPSVFSWLVLPLLVLIPFGVLIMTITIIRATIAKIDGANYAGMGVVVLFVSLVLKVMTYAGILPTMHLVITMLDIGFIFMMSLILGSRFSIQFVKVETLQAETERQRADIDQKKQQLELQKELVEEKNKEILDSINYAKRIQAAILPPTRIMSQFLPQHFILYKPKDIVAGDFYWLETSSNSVAHTGNQENTILVAAADCTGHGVPGSLVSVICNNGLNRSVREHGLTDPGKILDKTRQIIITEFEKSDDEVKDGMDISLISLSSGGTDNDLSLQWAGANNPLWILRPGTPESEEIKTGPSATAQIELVGKYSLIEVKADKQPIGKFANAKPFTTHSIKLKKGDLVYLFTDGYADQFGGEKRKKFKYAHLKQLLAEIAHETMPEQLRILEKRLTEWRGELEQTDDICLIGIRV